ncbi:hypothetical protein D3C85_1391750 [compost metagenome]
MVEATILLGLLGSTLIPPNALFKPEGVIFVHCPDEILYLHICPLSMGSVPEVFPWGPAPFA